MHVRLRNERTGELKEVKVGWSWTLFLFSWFLGLPLFLRKLNTWGVAMLALCIFYWVLNILPDDPDELTMVDILFLIVGVSQIGMQIYFGIKGNELTGKNMLENGWEFADQEDRATDFARSKWSLA